MFSTGTTPSRASPCLIALKTSSNVVRGISFAAGDKPLRGKQAVAEFWKKFYDAPAAPFAWEPGLVQVLDSGTLALSSGPVRDASGKHFANFQSIWRQESQGVWKIVFDRGERVCDCAK